MGSILSCCVSNQNDIEEEPPEIGDNEQSPDRRISFCDSSVLRLSILRLTGIVFSQAIQYSEHEHLIDNLVLLKSIEDMSTAEEVAVAATLFRFRVMAKGVQRIGCLTFEDSILMDIISLIISEHETDQYKEMRESVRIPISEKSPEALQAYLLDLLRNMPQHTRQKLHGVNVKHPYFLMFNEMLRMLEDPSSKTLPVHESLLADESQEDFIYLSSAATLQMDLRLIITNVFVNACLYGDTEPVFDTIVFIGSVEHMKTNDEVRNAGQLFRFRIMVNSRQRIGCLNEADTIRMNSIRDVVGTFDTSDYRESKDYARSQDMIPEQGMLAELCGDNPVSVVILFACAEIADSLMRKLPVWTRNKLEPQKDYDPTEYTFHEALRLLQDPNFIEMAKDHEDVRCYLSDVDTLKREMIDIIMITQLRAIINREYEPLVDVFFSLTSVLYMETSDEILNAAKLLRFRVMVDSPRRIGCLTERDSILTGDIQEVVRVADCGNAAMKNEILNSFSELLSLNSNFDVLDQFWRELSEKFTETEKDLIHDLFFARVVYDDADFEPHTVLQTELKWRRRHQLAKKSRSGDQFESQFRTKYKPIKLLGQGTFGCVFKVETWRSDLNRMWICAVKRIAVSARTGANVYAMREQFLSRALRSKGIVQSYDVWLEETPEGWQRDTDAEIRKEINSEPFDSYEEDDSHFVYIEMELCDSNLAEWLSENTNRGVSQLKNWFSQIVSAIEYMHDNNYIHRDLKPHNILFAGPYEVKVCDLGLATREMLAQEGSNEVLGERSFDKGTSMYMAPEQRGWVDYSAKVDIFALGLIFAEMCVVMPDLVEKKKIFDKYRRGKPNDILRDIPDAEKFVAWLTNPIDTERPDARTVASCSFLNTF